MKPLHVLCLDQFGALGGGQQCLLDLLPFLQEKNCQTEVLVPGAGNFTDRLQTLGCPVRFFESARLSHKTKPLWEVVPYLLNLRNALRSLQDSARTVHPDLVYVTGPRYLPAASWLANRRAVPLLFHAHNRVQQNSALAVATMAVGHCRARVLACCQWVASSLYPRLPSTPVEVIYNGTPDLYRSSVRPGRQIRTIGVVGRIAPEKGQLAFLRALRQLPRTDTDRRFVIVGSASAEQLNYYLAVLRESAGLKVTFTGWQDDVATALAGLDLLVVPSLPHDAAPRVIPEAFSACVPVLACPSGGIPELIEDGVTGFLTRGTGPSDISRRLYQILNLSHAAVAKVTMNARARWVQRYQLGTYREKVWAAMMACRPTHSV